MTCKWICVGNSYAVIHVKETQVTFEIISSVMIVCAVWLKTAQSKGSSQSFAVFFSQCSVFHTGGRGFCRNLYGNSQIALLWKHTLYIQATYIYIQCPWKVKLLEATGTILCFLSQILYFNYNGDWTAWSHPDVMTVYIWRTSLLRITVLFRLFVV